MYYFGPKMIDTVVARPGSIHHLKWGRAKPTRLARLRHCMAVSSAGRQQQAARSPSFPSPDLPGPTW